VAHGLADHGKGVLGNRLVGGDIIRRVEEAPICWRTMRKENFSTRLKGTAIRMNLDTTEIGNVSARLRQFRKEAQSIAEKYIGLRARNPSYMSMVLRRDFRMDGI
jgi:hypothetical protein